MKIRTPQKYFVYIAYCSDGTFYTGYTNDLKAREARHNKGRGARYTMRRRPVMFLYTQQFSAKREAMQREYEIKKLSRKEKEFLVGTEFSWQKYMVGNKNFLKNFTQFNRRFVDYSNTKQRRKDGIPFWQT